TFAYSATDNHGATATAQTRRLQFIEHDIGTDRACVEKSGSATDGEVRGECVVRLERQNPVIGEVGEQGHGGSLARRMLAVRSR
ncbi:MAG TPA: hypothetical protein PLP26_03280, partial [Ilumatobacteraceae bacterium]|nr:hypothetical protein [Ilumatobacteraceae bacterium]